MSEAKIQFSGAEIDLMCNADVLLTKNRVMAGIRLMLEELQAQMQQLYYYGDLSSLAHVFSEPPKISRGEQYLGLPYLVLDYPRQFGNPDIFAIRTLFWWGHSFSVTLHLAGEYAETFRPKLVDAFGSLQKAGFFIGVHEEDPWQHHFGGDNYRPLQSMDIDGFERIAGSREHLKLAKEFSLRDVHFISEELLDCWTMLLQIIVHPNQTG